MGYAGMLSYHSKTFLASKSWRNLYPLFFPMSITPILWGVVLCIGVASECGRSESTIHLMGGCLMYRFYLPPVT